MSGTIQEAFEAVGITPKTLTHREQRAIIVLQGLNGLEPGSEQVSENIREAGISEVVELARIVEMQSVPFLLDTAINDALRMLGKEVTPNDE